MVDSTAYAELALSHIRYLSETIGGRGSTTHQERQGAQYACDTMAGARIPSRLEPFRSGRSTYRPFVLAFGAALISTALYFATHFRLVALVAGAISALSAWGMFAELDFSSNWMRKLLPTGSSQNAVGVVQAKKNRRHRIVLLGHVDTHRTPVFYSSTTWHKLFVALVGGTFISLAVSAVVYILLAVTGWVWLHWALIVATAVQLFALVLCVHADITPYSPGANDNASGVGTILALGHRLAQYPLQHTEVWLVADGCEELGCYGAAALVDQHPDELRNATIIALDIVGAGDPAFLINDGLLRKYPVDSPTLSIARQVSKDHPALRAFEHAGIAYTDSAVLLKRGYRAFTIDALPREEAGAVQWHQMTDTVDRIELDCLRRVHEFVWNILTGIDQEQQSSAQRST
ncbi:MAG: Zn-dependent exopeptidase M28 [Chloroflexi bacterium]|nr:Zn-dependent exopeptidase M28 [Chloroflexota bacterium]